jgi:predicted phage terminase large subunit-like protein
MKFLRLHLPATNDSGRDAWFSDGYSGQMKMFAPYSALWPHRYPRHKLDSIFHVIHPYYKKAQYDQEPSMGDLGYFDLEKMPRYQSPTCECSWIAVDAAQTESKAGSFTAFVCLGLSQGQLKVLAVRRGRWRQDVMCDQLVDFYAATMRLTGLYPERIIVEQAAGGFGIIDHLGGQLPIEPIIPRGSKEERAGAVCYLTNRGQVALPESAPWLKAFTEELQNFPLCSQKDQVDAFVHALSYAARPSEFRPQEQVIGAVNLIDDLDLDILGDSFDSDFERFTGGSGELISPATQRALNKWRG